MELRLTTLGMLALLAGSCTSDGSVSRGNGREPMSEPTAPLVAEVECLDSGPRVVTPTVQAQADGVHIRVVNRSDRALRIRFEAAGEWPLSRKPSRLILAIEPGLVSVACHPKGTHNRDREPTDMLRVLDPHRLWRSGQLTCPEGFSLFVESATSIGNSIEEAAEEVLKPLRAEDEVRRLGYPDEATPSALVVHRGEAVLVLGFRRVPEYGLVYEGAHGCLEGQRLLRH
jgi:hypothetical protein